MGDSRPKSPQAVGWFGGPDGYDRFIGLLTKNDPFGLAYDYAGSLTYAEGWKRHIEPQLKERNQSSGSVDDENPGLKKIAPPSWQKNGNRMTGGASSEMGPEEAKEFFDRICGGRVYKGPKWWIPGEVKGVKMYDGKN